MVNRQPGSRARTRRAEALSFASFQKHCGSVCRAGGKPSTWFPPGTRRAVNASNKFFYLFFSERFQIQNF